MNKTLNIINRLLDILKGVLVRFKNAGFGIFFIKNLFTLPDFFKDPECSIFSKIKVVCTFLITLFYFVSSVDIIPEFLLGGFGVIDDVLICIWSIGLINDELCKYKKMVEDSPRSNILEDVNWKIHDDE